MLRYQNQIIRLNNRCFKQITRPRAKRLYDQGQAIYITSRNLNLKSPWNEGHPVEFQYSPLSRIPFERHLLYYTSYNNEKLYGSPIFLIPVEPISYGK